MMRTAAVPAARTGARLGPPTGGGGPGALPAAWRSGYSGQMKRASISEAKNRLSAYVDRVRGGETILITDRGRPVARLAPLEPGTRTQQDARLAELERRGIVRLGRKAPPRRLPRPAKLRKAADAARLIAEDRERR